MRFPHWIEVFRPPAEEETGANTIQDEDGLLVDGRRRPVLVFACGADVQDPARERRGPQTGPESLNRDADCFLEDESLLVKARAGFTARIRMGTERKRDATVVGVRELDGRLLLNWVSRVR